MTSTESATGLSVLSLRCEQRVFPPYDAFHATPSPMLWRQVIIETASGRAALEQTDYGHPGRLNGWQPRGISPALLPRLQELTALAESAAALM